MKYIANRFLKRLLQVLAVFLQRNPHQIIFCELFVLYKMSSKDASSLLGEKLLQVDFSIGCDCRDGQCLVNIALVAILH